jgi:hypothetical protein
MAWNPTRTQLTTASFTALRAWRAETFTQTATVTNALADSPGRERTEVPDLAQLVSSDPHALLPVLDLLMRESDPTGFWRKVRAMARLYDGDLQGAIADNPAYAIPARSPQCSPRELDLSPFYNQLLSPIGRMDPGTHLGELPVAVHTLDGTTFDLRGIVQISGTSPHHEIFPEAVSQIPVGQYCRKLHALQATEYEANDGTTVGRFVLLYRDGETRELPIVYGEDLRNWWTIHGEPTNTPNAHIVWRGNCPRAREAGRSLRLW